MLCCQGVWAGSLEISPRPVLGNWNISVDVNGQIFTKEFQVAEYILPKFQVGHSVRCAVKQLEVFVELVAPF